MTKYPIVIEFGMVGVFARVNGNVEMPPGIKAAIKLDEYCGQLKSERDRRWPPQQHRHNRQDDEWHETTRKISRLSRRIARIRLNALHVWTTGIIARAGSLMIIEPAIKDNTESPRGNAKNWGAAVEPVSALNRYTLACAPAMAIKMLEYKAKELGIPVQPVKDPGPEIAEGRDLVATIQTLRRARRMIKPEEGE